MKTERQTDIKSEIVRERESVCVCVYMRERERWLCQKAAFSCV
jgi:hypothetical protein